MRIMVLGKATKETESGVLPTATAWEEMEQFNNELEKRGILITGEGLLPSSAGVRIRCSGKDRLVTNGPFAETREVIAGYSVWEVKSIEEAIAWAQLCPLPDGAEIELRPLFTYSADEVNEILDKAG
jgi:hypothetical protein